VAYGAGEDGRWKIGVVRIGRVRETTGGIMVEVTDWSVREVSDGNLGRRKLEVVVDKSMSGCGI
jgi:hypothetical protein